MQLFYSADLNKNSATFTFSKDESRHIIKVLRKKNDDQIAITNGKGLLFYARIESAHEKKCMVSITEVIETEKTPYQLHMAVAPTKLNDRYEWFLEKATEIGIAEITPLICENSERKVIKADRMKKILLSAMKQSQQCYLPRLNAATNFKDFIKADHKGKCFIAHCHDMNRASLKSRLVAHEDVTILIGPEGDFSVKEIEMALERNYIPVTLGKTRLRTETAAIAACHSVAFIHED